MIRDAIYGTSVDQTVEVIEPVLNCNSAITYAPYQFTASFPESVLNGDMSMMYRGCQACQEQWTALQAHLGLYLTADRSGPKFQPVAGTIQHSLHGFLYTYRQGTLVVVRDERNPITVRHAFLMQCLLWLQASTNLVFGSFLFRELNHCCVFPSPSCNRLIVSCMGQLRKIVSVNGKLSFVAKVGSWTEK